MELDDSEEKLLRSVALQNARAVLLARERAEQKLWDATKDLERKTEELTQQREWFQVTLSSIGDAVITTDTEGKVTFLNPVAEEMTGWTLKEGAGHPLEEVFNIVNESTRKRVDNPIAKVLREGIVVGLANHTVLISRNGTETAIEDSAAPIRDSQEKIVGAVMVFHDVTARRKAENALRRSEQLLSEFFENAAVGLHWVAPDGKVLRVNQTELKLLGYSKEEYVGRHISEFHEDQTVIDDILSKLACGKELTNYEARLRCKDGSIKHVLISSNVLWENGEFIHTRCFTRDITEQKLAQIALEEAQKKLSEHAQLLEKQVVERTHHLNQTIQSLEGVCYTIAHDLRAPLRAVQGFTKIILDDYSPCFDELGREFAGRIMKGANRMDILIRDLLAYARLSQVELPCVELDLNMVIEALLQNMVPEIEAQQAKISVQRLPVVKANNTLVQQIFENLINNAMKFVDAGVTPEICIRADSTGNGRRIFVSDNGIGIAPEYHDRVFGMFQRLHGDENKFQGTGIGLAIVKKAIERMGGSVAVASGGAGGTCFVLEFQPPQTT